jgi:hypothetical protein
MSAPQQQILVPPDKQARARAISVFYQLGMPGMTLMGAGGIAPKSTAPLPKSYSTCDYLLESGEPCGRRISRNKTRCGRCYLAALRQVAESLTPELLEEYLKDMAPLDRLEVMGSIRPFLKFALPLGGGTTP